MRPPASFFADPLTAVRGRWGRCHGTFGFRIWRAETGTLIIKYLPARTGFQVFAWAGRAPPSQQKVTLVPVSKKRKKQGRPVEAEDTTIASWTDGIPTSPSWWAPTFVTLMLLGLVWLVVVYMTNFAYPIPKVGNWNLAVGFGLMFAGFIMTLRWR